MRHFKIFSFCLITLLLASCSGKVSLLSRQGIDQGLFSSDMAVPGGISGDGSFTGTEIRAPLPSEMVRVGLLLPLSGSSEKLGKSLQNAALMSLFDIPGNRLVLQFYDTQGTPEGARKASEQAINQGVELIIGPVFSQEVRAIRENAHSADVGVITFSSDPSNLGDGVYTISTLTSQQVEHVVGFACDRGYKRFAVLSQDNATGDIVSMAAKAAADRCGGMITKAAFYNPKSENLQPSIQSIMPKLTEDAEKERLDDIRRLEKEMNAAAQGLRVKVRNKSGRLEEKSLKPEEVRALIDKLKATQIEREPFEFDAILVTEEGSRLRSLGALLSYYDIPSGMRVLGTSQWADSTPAREPAFIGGWFSNLPSAGFNKFANRYKKIYGDKPPRIASQGYDAVALAAVLAETGNFSYKSLTNPSGFKGVDGIFRLLPNGLSERGLEILGVEKKGFVSLSRALEIFDTEPVFSPEVYNKGFRYSPDLITVVTQETETVPVAETVPAKPAKPRKAH